MLSLPKRSTAAATNNDMSSICNYMDVSPQSGFMYDENSLATLTTPQSNSTPKNNFICGEAFAYRDEAIPFITVSEETSKCTEDDFESTLSNLSSVDTCRTI